VTKKNVVEINCDRCDRTEYVDPSLYSGSPDLALTFGAHDGTEPEVHVAFDDLCSSCKKTVKNLSEQIAKKISWKRNKGGAEEPEDKKEEGTTVIPSSGTGVR